MVETTSEQDVFEADQLNGLVNACELARLRVLDRIDAKEGWREDGARSIEDWAAYRYSWSLHTVNEKIRVARAIRDLPRIAEAFGGGSIAWESLVDLCSFVTADEDEEWAERAQRSTAALVARFAAHARRRRREEAALAQNKRSLSMRWDGGSEMLRLSGLFPGAEGVTIQKTIERIAQSYGPEPDGTWAPFDQRAADALVELAGRHIVADRDADRATVVVHVDLADFNHIHGNAKLEDGPMVPSEVARRLACDSRLQFAIYDPNGHTVGIGRVSQSIPPWLRRLVKERDERCVVCGAEHAHQVHHVIHFAHGGPTDLDNLVLLCRRCHAKVHDLGFRLVKDGDGSHRLIRPDGQPVMTKPAPLNPEIRERMLGPDIERRQQHKVLQRC